MLRLPSSVLLGYVKAYSFWQQAKKQSNVRTDYGHQKYHIKSRPMHKNSNINNFGVDFNWCATQQQQQQPGVKITHVREHRHTKNFQLVCSTRNRYTHSSTAIFGSRSSMSLSSSSAVVCTCNCNYSRYGDSLNICRTDNN